MREVDRVEVIREVLGRRLGQREASERLGICVRQVKRLVRRYREEGARGLRSRRRGRRASNAIAPELRREIVGVVRKRYEDFAPTLAWEKLTEVHGYGVSVETLRKWMVAEGLWRSKKRPGARVHQSRPRRPALGELVQIDGSPHAWFEDREPRCTLIVFIDDATSRLMALRFAEAETTEAYMRTLRGYLDQHGRPVALYSDKHRIFRVNQKDREGDLTQFLNLILSLHTPRKLSRNLTCRYRSREYQIQGQSHGYRLRGSTVTVCESFDGPISLLCQGKTLDYRVLAQGQTPIPTDDEKSLCRTVDKARSLQRKRPRYKPSPNHPWNRWARLHPAPSTPTP